MRGIFSLFKIQNSWQPCGRAELESQHGEATKSSVCLSRVPTCVWEPAGAEVVTGQRRLARQAQILSASIKPLPALAALSTTKTHPNKHKPAFVSHLFLSLCVSGTRVWETLSKVLPVVSPGHWHRDFSPSPGTSPSWSLLQDASHHLSHLPE